MNWAISVSTTLWRAGLGGKRPIPEGGATWVPFGVNVGATDGALSLQSASDDLRQLTGAELVRAGQALGIVAPKTVVPSGETRDTHRAGDVTSPWWAAIPCPICPMTAGR